VSLACPISSDELINTKRSEESLVMSSVSCAPISDAGPVALIAVLPTAKLLIAHALAAGLPIAPATIPLPALAVPIAYANFPQQHRHSHEIRILSTDAAYSLQTAWTDLTPSLDHQDIILAVNRRHGSNLVRLPSAADGALLAQRTRVNILSATTAVQSAKTLAAELSTSHKGFPKDPRRKHG